MVDNQTLRERHDLLFLVSLSLLGRLAYSLALKPVLDSADAVLYLQTAENLFHGNLAQINTRIPLLYPALTALVRFLMGDIEFCAIAIALIASSLIPLSVYWLARDLFDLTTARIAGVLTAFWPWLVDYGSRVAPESLATLIWLSAIGCLCRAGQGKRKWLVFAVLLFFALHLCRPEGTFLLLFSPIMLAGLLAHYRPKNSLLLLGGMLGAYLALFLAQMAFTRWAWGIVQVNPRVPHLADSLQHTFGVRGDAWLRAGLDLWSRVLPTMIGPYLLMFVGVGLVWGIEGAFPRKPEMEVSVGTLCGCQFVLAALSTYPEPRYVMPVVVTSVLWASRGLGITAYRLKTLSRIPGVNFLPLAFALFLFLMGTFQALLPEYRGTPRLPREYKIAGMWMKEQLPPGLILTRKPQIGFYAGMPTTGPAVDDTVTSLVDRARRTGARYVVIDERYTTALSPGLKALLDPRHAPETFRCIRDDLSPYPNARVVIYEVVDTLSPLPDGTPVQ